MAFSAWFFHISVAIADGGRRYSGAASLDALHMARFVKISPTTVQENHPHDVTIAKMVKALSRPRWLNCCRQGACGSPSKNSTLI